MNAGLRILTVLAVTAASAWWAADTISTLWSRLDPTATAHQGDRSSRNRPAVLPRVKVDTTRVREAHPITEAYGTLVARRSLDLSTTVGGVVTDVADRLADGARVSEGTVLWTLDDTDAARALADAAAQSARDRLAVTELDTRLTSLRRDFALLEKVREVRRREQLRAEELRSRVGGSAAQSDSAELALLAAERDLVALALELSAAEIDRETAQLTLQDSLRAEDTARDALVDVQKIAPFDGLFVGMPPTPGQTLRDGDTVGQLLETDGLNVRVDLAASDVGRLLGPDGALLPLDFQLRRIGDPATAQGHLTRQTLERAEDATDFHPIVLGRVTDAQCDCLRPGDRVVVTLSEPKLTGVSILPATAIDLRGTVLSLDAENRLVEVAVRVLRRQGDQVIIVAPDHPLRYVRTRQPTLGDGVRIDPVIDAPAATEDAHLAPKLAAPSLRRS